MDIISHGLWGALAAKAVNRRSREHGRGRVRTDVLLTAFLGIAPDLIAFTPITLLFGYGILSGSIDPYNLPRPAAYHSSNAPIGIYVLTGELYSFTHSAVVLLAVAMLTWFIRRYFLHRRGLSAIPLEMMGWLLHVLVDIFTHSDEFYPTPVLWPFSRWHFNGLAWAETPWILPFDFGLLMLTYLWISRRQKAPLQSEPEPVLQPVRAEK